MKHYKFDVDILAEVEFFRFFRDFSGIKGDNETQNEVNSLDIQWYDTYSKSRQILFSVLLPSKRMYFLHQTSRELKRQVRSHVFHHKLLK